ncbi:MAG TPA: hypothetical protein DCY13_04405 [Verrucomicrobiales bacterium]|nr:hypothetical protein [Verrucomicrobiales bacterium]
MFKYVVILLIGLIFEAVGVVYLSRGLKQIGEPAVMNAAAVWGLIRNGAINPNVLFGVLCEAIFFGTLLFLLSRGDVSFIWPLTSLGLVLTTIAARFILKEEVSYVRWMGVFLIVVGSGLITWSEKTKERKQREGGEVAVADGGEATQR